MERIRSLVGRERVKFYTFSYISLIVHHQFNYTNVHVYTGWPLVVNNLYNYVLGYTLKVFVLYLQTN